MIRTFYICLLTGLLAACNEAPKKGIPAETAKPAEQAPEPAQTAAIAGKFPDAVCGMPYDTAYHEWSVYKKDTLHFCSSTCKRVFDKNPEKYASKLGL
ncbi:YHS domain-containing protein [Chitinophaga oryziterrae]|uniref:YHS domain-containing protein n=1 Tax=Chitinophaga oryziterrae TaxID=1031224 RepID=A0A6N8JKF4_9BACT|nr:YHS domain-containing protein [Chitinophaga oryziterrae]MVT44931.1 YHS domain-containing protein [Chitinophaga oryziterrae]